MRIHRRGHAKEELPHEQAPAAREGVQEELARVSSELISLSEIASELFKKKTTGEMGDGEYNVTVSLIGQYESTLLGRQQELLSQLDRIQSSLSRTALNENN